MKYIIKISRHKMNQSTGYKKFNIGFNVIILLFALSIIISTLTSYKETDRGLLYIILGIIIGSGSAIRLYKSFK